MKSALGFYKDEWGKGAAAPLPHTLSPRCRRSVAPKGAPIPPEGWEKTADKKEALLD